MGEKMNTCLNCEKTDQEIPLLKMRYREADVFICPQCLPVLIHHPENLADKLPGMDIVKPAGPGH
jgi:hypothetical protein